jgi:hypothetical protein
MSERDVFRGRNPFAVAGWLVGLSAPMIALLIVNDVPLGAAVYTTFLVLLWVWIWRSETQDVIEVDPVARTLLARKRRLWAKDAAPAATYTFGDVEDAIAACTDTDGVYQARVRMRDGALYEIGGLHGGESAAKKAARAFIAAVGREDLCVVSEIHDRAWLASQPKDKASSTASAV